MAVIAVGELGQLEVMRSDASPIAARSHSGQWDAGTRRAPRAGAEGPRNLVETTLLMGDTGRIMNPFVLLYNE